MADNVGYTPGTGATIAADEIGGVLYQRVKAVYGADGSAADMDEKPATDAKIDALIASAATEATTEAMRALVEIIRGAIYAEDTQHTDGDPGFLILAQRRDSDTSSVGADGDYTTLKMDEAGRLKVSAQPGSQAATTGNITTNTGVLSVDVSRTSNITIHCVNTGLSGATFNFEGSINSTNGTDGNWFAVQAVRTNANTIETAPTSISTTPTYGWELSVNGLKYFRIRASAGTFGTSTWAVQPAPYATEPVPAIQAHALTAATARVGFVAGAGIWYDDSSATLTANSTFTGTSRDATVTASATAIASASAYTQEVRLSAESDVGGTLWLEVSRDNTNWRRVKSVATAAVTGGGQYAEIVHRPSWRYWRAGYTNGATGQARFTLNSLAMAV